MGVRDFQMAGMGIFGYTAYINPDNKNLTGMITAIIVSIICVIVAMVLELIFYKDDVKKTEKKTSGNTNAIADNSTLSAPIAGTVVDLCNVKDEVFSTEAMGKGIAIEPSEGKVFAPADGTISTFFPTGHAIGITTDSGAEILIHVGMDTVDMNGDGFSPKKKQDDRVKKGELLLEFDIEKIKAAGHPATTPVIITNSDDYADVIPTASGEIHVGDELLKLM